MIVDQLVVLSDSLRIVVIDDGVRSLQLVEPSSSPLLPVISLIMPSSSLEAATTITLG